MIARLLDNVKCKSLTATSGRLDLNGYNLDSVGDVTVNSSAGSFRFYNGTDYWMQGGSITLRSGQLSLNGDSSLRLSINDLNFDLVSGVTGVAEYVDVYDSICTYVTSEIDADSGTSTNVGGTVTGWDFTGTGGPSTYEETLALAATLNQLQPTQITAYNSLALAATLNQLQSSQLDCYNTLALAATLGYSTVAGVTFSDTLTLANTLNSSLLHNARYWVGATTDWSNTNNWSYSSGGTGGALVPTNEDYVIIDTGTTGTTLTAAATCYNLDIGGSFIGSVDTDTTNNYQFDIVKNVSVTGGSILYFRESNVTIGGNVTIGTSSSVIAGTTEATNHVSLTGSSKSITNNSGSSFCGFTIADGASYTIPNNLLITGPIVVAGTLTNNATLSSNAAALSRRVASTGVFNGSGTVYGYGSFTNDSGGSWANNIRLQVSSAGLVGYLNGGDFNCNVEFNGSPTANRQMYWQNNNIIRGNYTITKGGSFSLTQNNSTYNPNLTFEGNITLSISGGSVAWTKGTGTITFSGSNNQTIDLRAFSVEDIVVNKSGGLLTLAWALTTDSFTGTDGDMDLNGKVLTSSGNVAINHNTGFRFWDGTTYSMSDGKFDVNGGTVTLTGAPGDLLYIRDLDFDLASGVTGSATYTSVYDSICIYVTSPMSATGGTNVNEGGTNTGWSFGVTWNETVSLANTLNQSQANQLTAYNTLALANTLNSTQATTLTAYNTLALANTLTYATSTGATFNETVSLANTLNQSQTNYNTIYTVVTLPVTTNLTLSNQLTAVNTLSIAGSFGFAVSTGSIFNEPITFASTFNETHGTQLTATNTLLLTNTLNITNNTQLTAYNQVALNLITNLTEASTGTFGTSLVLATNLTAATNMGSTFGEALIFGNTLNSSQSIVRNTYNTLSLAVTANIATTNQANLVGNVLLTNTLNQALSTQLVAQDNLVLSNLLQTDYEMGGTLSATITFGTTFRLSGTFGGDPDEVYLTGASIIKSEISNVILVKL